MLSDLPKDREVPCNPGKEFLSCCTVMGNCCLIVGTIDRTEQRLGACSEGMRTMMHTLVGRCFPSATVASVQIILWLDGYLTFLIILNSKGPRTTILALPDSLR